MAKAKNDFQNPFSPGSHEFLKGHSLLLQLALEGRDRRQRDTLHDHIHTVALEGEGETPERDLQQGDAQTPNVRVDPQQK